MFKVIRYLPPLKSGKLIWKTEAQRPTANSPHRTTVPTTTSKIPLGMMRTTILLAVALATEKHSAVAYDSPENIVLLDAVGEEIALVDAAAEELVGPLTSGKAGKSSISKAEKEEYTSDSAEPDEVEAKAFKGTKSSKGGDSSMSMAKAFKDGKSAKAGYGRYFYKITVLL